MIEGREPRSSLLDESNLPISPRVWLKRTKIPRGARGPAAADRIAQLELKGALSTVASTGLQKRTSF